MKKAIVVMIIATVVRFGMTKQEFERENGYPGACSTTTMPGVKFEECTIHRYNSDESYSYVNGKLFSWNQVS